jgi:hypothetical protein
MVVMLENAISCCFVGERTSFAVKIMPESGTWVTWLRSTNGSTDVQRSPVCSSQILMMRLSAERSLRSPVGVFRWIKFLMGRPMP